MDSETDDPAASEFARAMHTGAQRLKQEIGYNPTRWMQMVADHGAVEAARRLLRGTDVSDGFVKLWEHQRLDETVEWYVLAYPSLFDDDEREIAYQRLKRYDVPVDRWLRERLGRRYP